MQLNVRPKFEVEPVDDSKYKRTIAKHDGKTLSYTQKTEKRGYMVYFPQGHSIHVRDERELKRLGFDRQPSIVDMESGEEVGYNTSLKERVVRKTKVSRNSETLDELDGE